MLVTILMPNNSVNSDAQRSAAQLGAGYADRSAASLSEVLKDQCSTNRVCFYRSRVAPDPDTRMCPMVYTAPGSENARRGSHAIFHYHRPCEVAT